MNKYERNSYHDRHFRRHDLWPETPFDDEPSASLQMLYGLMGAVGFVMFLLLTSGF